MAHMGCYELDLVPLDHDYWHRYIALGGSVRETLHLSKKKATSFLTLYEDHTR